MPCHATSKIFHVCARVARRGGRAVEAAGRAGTVGAERVESRARYNLHLRFFGSSSSYAVFSFALPSNFHESYKNGYFVFHCLLTYTETLHTKVSNKKPRELSGQNLNFYHINTLKFLPVLKYMTNE